jgi:hypothetical protein
VELARDPLPRDGRDRAARRTRFAVLVFLYPAQLTGRGPDRVQEKLVALAQRYGWIAVDPLPPFRAAARGPNGPIPRLVASHRN